ncbi:MAG: hypothetical protein JXA54_11230 [Candidatus Heimdallarchaeota archaeon]|nr:hypothetical protein [Candidatus Heimdallarchaeota archaeon]
MFFRKIKEAVKEIADDFESAVDGKSSDKTKRDGDSGSRKTISSDETNTLPVKCTIRLKSNRYNRLSMRTRVEVSSKSEYDKMKGSLITNFRSHFGTYSTMSGKRVNVWTDKAFNEIAKTLVFEDANLVEALKKHGKW